MDLGQHLPIPSRAVGHFCLTPTGTCTSTWPGRTVIHIEYAATCGYDHLEPWVNSGYLQSILTQWGLAHLLPRQTPPPPPDIGSLGSKFKPEGDEEKKLKKKLKELKEKLAAKRPGSQLFNAAGKRAKRSQADSDSDEDNLLFRGALLEATPIASGGCTNPTQA